MNDHLRVLILEDSPDDADLMVLRLEEAGFTPDWKRVQTQRDFLAALTDSPDLILADYHLPGFTGVEALRLLNERGLDIPFILVSGKVGEDMAVEAMRNGAADYLLKDRLARLGEATCHALEQQELRQEKQRLLASLQANEARFRSLIENISDMIVLVNAEGRILYTSPAAQKILGYSQAELLNQQAFVLIYPEDLPTTLDIFIKTLGQPNSTAAGELRILRKDGVIRWVHVVGTNLLDEPNVRAIVSVYRDITERKQAERAIADSEERYRDLVENIHELICTHDLDGNILSVNRATDLLGYTREEMLGRNLRDFIAPDVREDFGHYLALIQTRGVAKGLMKVQAKSGELRLWEYHNTLRTEGVERPIVRGYAHDVTEQYRAEQALRESQAMLQTVLNTIPVRVFWKDKALKYLGCNLPFALDAGAQSPDELIGKDDFQMGWREQAEAYQADDRLVIESGQSKLGFEEPQTRPDGRQMWLRTSKVPLRNGNRDIRGVLGTYEDITERKQAAQALQESEARYRSLFENSPVAVWEEDFSDVKRYLDSLRQGAVQDFREYFASHPEEVTRCNLMIRVLDVNETGVKIYNAGDKKALLDYTNRTITSGEQEHNPEDFIAIAEGRTANGWEGRDSKPNGEALDIKLTWSVVPGYEADYSRVVVTTEDITERRWAEEEIKKQLAELQRWHTATLGREDRILNLKREINDLLVNAGQLPRYPSAE